MRTFCAIAVLIVLSAAWHGRCEAQANVVISARSFVSAGRWMCTIDARRDVYCWLLAHEDSWPRPAIVNSSVQFEKVAGLADVVALDGTKDYICALDAHGGVQCWGCILTQRCRLWPRPIPLAGPARQLAIRGSRACALLQSGAAQCWGLVTDPESGDRVLTERAVTVQLPVRAVQLTGTANQHCVLDDAGRVTCWGHLSGGADTDPPRRVTGLDDVRSIAGNDSYACAIVSPRREVRCWGMPPDLGGRSRVHGSASDGSDDTVVRVGALRDVKQLELGQPFGVALTDDGSVYQWSESHYGGIRHIGQTLDQNVRVSFDVDVRPTFPSRKEPTRAQIFRFEPRRIASRLKVQALVVSNDYACLDLESGERLCEWLLSKTPFHLQEVWPQVRLDNERDDAR